MGSPLPVGQQAHGARPRARRREVHRHVGDFTLFWAGLYPEALRKLQSLDRRDYFLDYCAQGKRAYYIASTIPGGDDGAASEVLRRSREDELQAARRAT